MILSRFLTRRDGIFGHLLQDNGTLFCVTLEHAWPDGLDYKATIPLGTYVCRRGLHRLHNMMDPFETFEITGVEGHSGLLFHAGNYNTDSTGCILVGQDITESQGLWMISQSRTTFDRFLALHEGEDSFVLTVEQASVA